MIPSSIRGRFPREVAQALSSGGLVLAGVTAGEPGLAVSGTRGGTTAFVEPQGYSPERIADLLTEAVKALAGYSVERQKSMLIVRTQT